jgi:hypothetical protein
MREEIKSLVEMNGQDFQIKKWSHVQVTTTMILLDVVCWRQAGKEGKARELRCKVRFTQLLKFFLSFSCNSSILSLLLLLFMFKFFHPSSSSSSTFSLSLFIHHRIDYCCCNFYFLFFSSDVMKENHLILNFLIIHFIFIIRFDLISLTHSLTQSHCTRFDL